MDPCSCNCNSFLLALLVLAAAFTASVDAAPDAFAVPTGQWAGIDGNWSTLDITLGEPAQSVQVLASTLLSEFWAVGDGGCQQLEPHCSSARGGLFRPEQSAHWSDMGIWALGLDHLGYDGNGHYGLDLLEFQAAQGDASFSLKTALVADINSTDYFLGYFGLGVTQANFGGEVAKSPLTQAVESYGLLPSYTYGYTAGAHYRDTPASLTLGGYDAARFVGHDDRFVLGSADNFPWALVRGIQANAPDDSQLTSQWNSSSTVLSGYSDSFTVVIDSTTPFLWLPTTICDAFASAFNLTYDDAFDLYILTNEQYETLRVADAYDFVFSLSSIDNADDFGDPLNVPGVVNITISSQALVSTLKYPYMDEAIAYGEPAVPYLALRKSSEAFIIGRSFLQEAYLVTEYDKKTFSIHQARFPEDSGAAMDIVAVEQPDNGAYPAPNSASSDDALSPATLGGIIVGSIVGVALVAISLWLCRRRRRRAVQRGPCTSQTDLEKKHGSYASKDTEPDQLSTLSRLINRLVYCGILNKIRAAPASNGDKKPAEAPNHEIFELPCPANPVELNGDDDDDVDNEAGYGITAQHTSAYEQARLRMDRQLAGPVPQYSPPASGRIPGLEKEPLSDENNTHNTNGDDNAVPPNNAESPQYAPVSPPASDMTFNGSVALSPLTPHAPSSGSCSFPRAATVGPHSTKSTTWSRSMGSALTNQTHSDASSVPISPSRIALPSSPRFQRTPIDASNVVFLGILPDQEHQTSRAPTPEILHPNGRPVALSGTLGTHASADTDAASFNSSFAGEDEVRWHLEQQEEQARIASALAAVRRAHGGETAAEGSTSGSHRRWSLQTEHYERSHDPVAGPTMTGAVHDGRASLDLAAGMEFVHVPQLPHRRYSWEEDD